MSIVGGVDWRTSFDHKCTLALSPRGRGLGEGTSEFDAPEKKTRHRAYFFTEECTQLSASEASRFNKWQPA